MAMGKRRACLAVVDGHRERDSREADGGEGGQRIHLQLLLSIQRLMTIDVED